ncbi:uncharacterized protein LOC100572096 [Acyrthosiphon pisum]|uniref:Uncharacterized protein n=1 Tax=Acyrthosiphon pisum TaxID=7029 RepID=A0A8R1W5V6_ACYPI|nr:uncharacterized protein LOC100572096 [Acyrthosiphon pisum]|eukprot:XP_003245040.1 PREDICTED: uncharacterized protein LOC100572096 [Acyrthosiphon pisum]
MIVTWICLVTIMILSLDVCQVENKANSSKKGFIIRTTKRVRDSRFFIKGKRFANVMRRLPSNLKRFMKWLQKHIRYGIKCFHWGINQMRCRTLGGLNTNIKMDSWNKLPNFIKKRLYKPAYGPQLLL